MREIAIASFFIGQIVAIIAAAKPAMNNVYANTLPIYISAQLISIIALLVWRMINSNTRKRELAHEDSLQAINPVPTLKALLSSIDGIILNKNKYDTYTLSRYIEEIIDTHIVPFQDVKNKLIHSLGVGATSGLLIPFARGERLLNRVYSAASDGHKAEAERSMYEAMVAFEESVMFAQKTLEFTE